MGTLMATSRTLKLSILADVDNLSRNLKQGEQDVQGFGDKLAGWGKMAGAAFLAAGAAAAAYAGKLAIDGVKAAIEDEAAQTKLALTLMNVAGATQENIDATEEWITQQGILYGVTDDELRPAIERLSRATGDVTKAQQLAELAMDISAGTGKSLEAVSQALGKAYEGQTGSLGRLGLGIDSATLKTMTFDEITGKLAGTFGGQATAKAETFEGQLQRLRVAFDEGKETIGSYILTAVTPLVTGFVENVIPAISEVANRLGGEDGLGSVFGRVGTFIKDVFGPILEGMRNYWDKISDAFIRNKDELEPLFTLLKTLGSFAADTLAPIIGKTLGDAFSLLGDIIGKVVDVFAEIVEAANKAYNAAKKVIDLIRSAGSAVGNFFSGASFSGPTIAAPIAPSAGFVNAAMTSAPTVTNITVNGAIDSEGTARTIYNVLRDSASRTGNYSTLGVNPLGLVSA